MEILIKVVQFFLCFTILVGIHEFGHFIVARIFKIRVEKFFIFFDPWFHLYSKKVGDTEYGVGWLPLGGYVKIAGMIDESMDKEQLAAPVQEDEFRAKPAWQRLLVMVAGVFMNFVLAVAIYCGISYVWGDSYLSTNEVKWGYNFNESAEALGFKDGDKIISIDDVVIENVDDIVPQLLITDSSRKITVDRDGQNVDIYASLETLVKIRKSKGFVDLAVPIMPFVIDSVPSTTNTLLKKGDQLIAFNGEPTVDYTLYREALQEAKGSDVTITVKRNNEIMDLSLTVDSEGRLGVFAKNPFVLSTRQYSLFESIPAGFRKTGDNIVSYWGQLKMIAKPETKGYTELGGFIAIGNIFSSSWNWFDFWMKTAFLSIMLGVMNLLPIPGLDGGHTLFTLWEIITRRKPSEKFLEVAQTIGMILLFALLIYANGNDIVRLFTK